MPRPFRAEIDRGVAEATAKTKRAGQIRRWTVLGDEWLPDSEQLTATMKLERRGVHVAYDPVIEAM